MAPAFPQGGIVPDYSGSLASEAKASKKDVISHEVTCDSVQRECHSQLEIDERLGQSRLGAFFERAKIADAGPAD